MDSNMLYRHGISDATYDKLATHQRHGCAICGHREHTNRRLRVDHAPSGHIRGLLCDKCHDWLLRIGQDNAIAHRAETYLVSPPAYEYLGKVGKLPKSSKRAPAPVPGDLRVIRERTVTGGTIVRLVKDGQPEVPIQIPIYPGT